VNALGKGLLVGAAQMVLVASVGAKFLYDRDHEPRLWVATAPYDPDLPIRGRYVSLALRVDVERKSTSAARKEGPAMFMARLEARDKRLVAVEDDNGRHWIAQRPCGERKCWQLSEPVAYFISEHVPDPSRRPEDETLWVEVTLPPEGAPRPIRLGVMKTGKLQPLER
jgi:GDYXXLXY protein